MALTQILVDAQSPDLETRRNAEQKLRIAEDTDFNGYVLSLSAELHNDQAPETSRQLAGLVLKNAFSGQDRKIDKAKREKWPSVPPEVANTIKVQSLETLSCEIDYVRAAACQVVSKIARIDIPLNRWEQLIPALLSLTLSANVHAKKGALTTYGYLCEDVQQLAEEVQTYYEVFSPESFNSVLTGVITGMKDPDLSVKLIATRALYHTVVFAYKNVQNEDERHHIFVVIGENLRCADERVQQAAWECMLQMASEYYQYLGNYINDLGELSLQTIQAGNEVTALPAIEFWNNLCDEEIQIMNGESDREMNNFIAKAYHRLLPVLFDVMTKQTSEDSEPSDWTTAMAAGTCVGLCAEVIRDDILELFMAFVQANFGHARWQNREAAVFAYGSIMEGPSAARLSPLVNQSFTTLCNSLADESVAVRDTTAWTVGRIAKFQYECIAPLLGSPDAPAQPSGLIALLISKLSDQPRVAQQICFALHEVAQHSRIAPDGQVYPDGTPSPVDAWLQPIVEALYATAQRHDASECKLRQAAYTAVSSVLAKSQSFDLRVVACKVAENILTLLDQSVNAPLTDEVTGLQGDLCGVLDTCYRRMDPAIVKQQAETAYKILWRVVYSNAPFQENLPVPPQYSTASEEALLAIGAIADSLQEDFEPLAGNFKQILLSGLVNRDDEQFCGKCVDLVGDLARALGKKFVIYAGDLLSELYNLLRDTNVRPSLKPPTMNAIGDVALSAGGDFEMYLDPILKILQQAAQTRIDQGPVENEDWLDFIQSLRDGVLWVYEGVLFGLRADNKLKVLKPEIPGIFEFIKLIADDPRSSRLNLTKAADILSDLTSIFPDMSKVFKENNDVCARLARATAQTH